MVSHTHDIYDSINCEPLLLGQGSSPFETKWRGAGYFKIKGTIVILHLHLNVNDYNTLNFKATGSSPFETKWRGSLYLLLTVKLH